jgi:hypothetical protein
MFTYIITENDREFLLQTAKYIYFCISPYVVSAEQSSNLLLMGFLEMLLWIGQG